jgi:intein-encoded DNA endonuclease-like protein
MTHIDCLRKLGYLAMTPGNKLVPARTYLIKHYCNKTDKFEEVEYFNEFHSQVKFAHFGDDKLDINQISVYKNISNPDERPLFKELL